jgi:hypothetical protein
MLRGSPWKRDFTVTNADGGSPIVWPNRTWTKRFADLSNRKTGHFLYSPQCGQLLVSILDPEPKESSDQ